MKKNKKISPKLILIIQLIVVLLIGTLGSLFVNNLTSRILTFIVTILVLLLFVFLHRWRLSFKNREINNINMEFTYFMSHEIRGFVTKIKGGLSLLAEGQYGNITREQRLYIAELLKQSEDFGSLIEEFLDISHLESDAEIKLKLGDSNVVNIVKGAVSDNKDALLHKNITVVYEGNFPEKFFSMCDTFKLQRVFSNIILNGVKYSPHGSTVSIGYIESRDYNILSIKDQGIGIPPLEQDGVFKKFFRASNARGLHSAGTGLGLYFSKLIVEHHGGKIWFESTEGRGTTFFVSLPKNVIKK